MGLHHIKSVARPSTLEDAWKERADQGGTARFLGGGIDVVLYTPPTVTTLVDLGGLGLNGIEDVGDALVIGAMTTMTDVIRSPLVGGFASGFMSSVLEHVASPLHRNLGTIGGTVASAHPWSDAIPALLALDAQLQVFDGESRVIDLGAYFADREAHDGTLIEAIRLPHTGKSRTAAYHAFTRTGFDVSLLNVACSATVEGGTWHDARIVVGGRPGLAQRQEQIEKMLEGAECDEAKAVEISRSAAKTVEVRDDLRASTDYRRTLVEVLMKRCLHEMLGKLNGGAE